MKLVLAQKGKIFLFTAIGNNFLVNSLDKIPNSPSQNISVQNKEILQNEDNKIFFIHFKFEIPLCF